MCLCDPVDEGEVALQKIPAGIQLADLLCASLVQHVVVAPVTRLLLARRPDAIPLGVRQIIVDPFERHLRVGLAPHVSQESSVVQPTWVNLDAAPTVAAVVCCALVQTTVLHHLPRSIFSRGDALAIDLPHLTNHACPTLSRSNIERMNALSASCTPSRCRISSSSSSDGLRRHPCSANTLTPPQTTQMLTSSGLGSVSVSTPATPSRRFLQ